MKTIADALNKFKLFVSNFIKSPSNYENIANAFESRKNQIKSVFLIHFKDEIIPVNISNIAIFFIEEAQTFIYTFNNIKYPIKISIDEFEKNAGKEFFRANRQYLINRKIVKSTNHLTNRKLLINLCVDFSDEIIVNKERVSGFLEWLVDVQ